jgi:anti-sigma regulatory factor (Ser/Thr protein kinase)
MAVAGGAVFEAEAATGVDALAALRRQVTAWLTDHGVGPRDAHDVLLVLNELVSNAFRHGQSGTARVGVRRLARPDRVEVTVANPAPAAAVPPPATWRLPDGLSSTGRGLAIVGAIGHRPEVRHVDGSVQVSTTIVLA